MMNDRFNIQRFGALFTRYWTEKKIANLLLWFVTGTLMAWFYQNVHYTWLTRGNGPGRIEEPVFLVGFSVFILVQMALAFTELNKRKTAANFLMIPASREEKYLFLLINHLIIPVVLYIGMAFLLDWLICKMAFPDQGMLLFQGQGTMDSYIRNNLYHFFVVAISVLYVYVGFFVFSKNQLIYSVLSLVLVFYYMLNVIGYKLIRNLISTDLFGGGVLDQVSYSHGKFLTQLDNGILSDYQPLSVVVVGLYFGGMIYVAYLKFTEKQARV